MMHTDWNGNGRHDPADDYVDYRLSEDSSRDPDAHSAPRRGSQPRRFPTWALAIVLVGIVSGELPINTLTTLLAVVIAVVLWIRFIS
ncbi:MAG: hypothetical protein ACI4MK_08335 [Aristaeellaceae bacterium]